jgi:hypothetical protein
VSAGLAIGVFCGLLFGLGVEKDEAVAATTDTTTTTSATKKPDGDVAVAFQPERKDVKVPSLSPQTVKKDGSAAGGSAAGGTPAAGTGSGGGSAETPAEPPKPTKVLGTLKIEILPEAAAKVAKILIDGKAIEGTTYELDMTEMVKDAAKKDPAAKEIKKALKIVVKASGFRDGTSKIDVIAERDTTLKVELVKRPTGGGGLRRPPPPGGTGGPKPPPKCRKPPCGLIDI